MSTNNNDRKLPMRVLMGYPLLNVSATLQMLLQMYFLLMFFTNFLGISGTAAGLIIMIARIWDFINDPMVGIIVEKSRRPNKCIFFMRCALVPVGIFMVLCYSAPDLSYTMKVVWAAVSFIGLGMSQTVFSISKDSLRPKLTSNGAERAKLNVYDNVYNTILNAVVPAVTMPLVGWLAGYGEATAFAKLAAIYAVVYAIIGYVGTCTVKGYEYEDYEEEGNVKSAAPSAGQMIKALVENRPALAVLTMQVVKMLISSIGGAVMVYYCTYNLGDVNAMSYASVPSTIVGLVPVLLLVPLYKRFGNAGTGLIGCTLAALSLLAAVITGVPSVTFYVVITTVQSLGPVMVSAVVPQCIMDCVDYGEWKTGHKNTSVIMSAYGIGTKIGLAFGTTVAGFVLDAVGFDPTAATQPANVLSAFFHLQFTAQLAVYVVMGLLLLYIYKIEKKLPELKKEIEARKAAQ
ncbi:glycoside-pentoside-hexuronide (GPH):cation symporter [Anaerovoracaceae bacterium 41-7]|uniref:MFS transporter n=1 Tax=Anaerovoracaceae TaxID=543314 RepID=UPI00203E188A|nr:glycoside-pentoside-hexuronide (GPH):cation symporter [Senimuribacter intestinalis]